MDYIALASELSEDPLVRGYASMTDAACADSLNIADRPGYKDVPARDLRRYLLLNGLWPAIQAVAADVMLPTDQRGAAITVIETLAPNSFDVLSYSDASVRAAIAAMGAALLAAGAVSADHKVAIDAMGNTFISRAQELGLGVVHHLDVAQARGTIQTVMEQ